MSKKQKISFFSKMCIIGGVFVLAGVSSCKTEYSPVVKPTVAVAEFIPASGSFVNSYYVQSNENPYLLPVGLTAPSSSDRTINFTVTSKTATAGQQYQTPSPVTIKAGKLVDTLRFKGLFATYNPPARTDTVTIRLKGYSAIDGQDSIQLVLQGYCDVISNDLIGNYTHTKDSQAGVGQSGGYTAAVSDWTATSATTATAKISGIGLSPDIGFGGLQTSSDPVITGLTINLDWTDPANFKVYIPAQTYIKQTLSYGASTITGTLGAGGLAGSFSSCSQTFTLTYEIAVSAGSFGVFTTSVVR